MIDKNKIKSAKPLYPEIMNHDAETILIAEFEKLKSLEEELQQQREKLRVFDKKYEEAKERYNKLIQFFDITFEQKEVKEIKNEVLFSINNKDDYRNKH